MEIRKKNSNYFPRVGSTKKKKMEIKKCHELIKIRNVYIPSLTL